MALSFFFLNKGSFSKSENKYFLEPTRSQVAFETRSQDSRSLAEELTISVSGMTSYILSCFLVSLMNLSFSGHMSGHVPTNSLDMSRSVLLARPMLTQCIQLESPDFLNASASTGSRESGPTLTQDLVSLLQETVFVLGRVSQPANEVEEGGRGLAL